MLRALLALLVASCAAGPARSRADDHSAAVQRAVAALVGSQKPAGFLRYGFDFLADREDEADSVSAAQLVRQAFAAAVLADHLLLNAQTPERASRVRLSVRSLLDALQARSRPIGASPLQALVTRSGVLSLPAGRYKLHSALDRLGLLYQPAGPGRVLSPDADYAHALAGATALALLAEVRYWQATRDPAFADLRRAWLEGLLVLRIPGAGFRQHPASIDPTPYFDGEAWLALAEYRRAFPDDARAAKVLAELDVDLPRFYGRSFDFDFFHWGAMAASARYLDTGDPGLLAFLEGLMAGGLKRMEHQDDDNNCAVVEGVADGLAALARGGAGGGELAGKARALIAREMAKAAGLQIRPGQEGLEFPGARVSAPRMREFAGDFLLGRYLPKVQVDMTAHCLSAMIKLRRHGISP